MISKSGGVFEEAKSLANELYNKAAKHDGRYILAISGIPGTGKTTFAKTIVHTINGLHPQSPPFASYLSMDGFHLTRAELSAMSNAEEAHARRGAPFTFSPEKLSGLLANLRTSKEDVYAPSFDHALKDPVENDVYVRAQTKLVVIEGNYLSLDQDVWRDLTGYFHEKWFVEVDREAAVQRVIKRHLAAGLAKTKEDAEERARGSDYMNADLILSHRLPVDKIVYSVDDAEMAKLADTSQVKLENE